MSPTRFTPEIYSEETDLNTSANNKRIAKNTLLLYLRQLITLSLSLYTSRLILQILGETDFGVYAAVGGVTSLLSVLITAMSSSTQRFIAFEIGRNNIHGVCNVFSTSKHIHYLLAIIVLFLGETIGSWFVHNYLNVETSKLHIAIIVYQISLINCLFAVVSVPYNALIIANERMGAFALFAIGDTLLKFIGVIVIPFIPINHLIAYASLICIVQVLSRILMFCYCKFKFPTIRSNNQFQPDLFKRMFGIAGWSSMGSISQAVYLQGSIITLNYFFGPIINAAYSVAMQAYSGLRQFCSSFQSASAPQIVKYYAAGELLEMHRLLQVVCKYSFFLILTLTLPFIITAKQIIGFWLVETPPYAPIYFIWMVIYSYFDVFIYPLDVAAQASGTKLAKYSIISSIITLAIVPIAYVLYKVNFPPETIVCVAVLFSLIGCLSRIILLSNLIALDVRKFIRNSMAICIVTGLISAILPVCCSLYLPIFPYRFFALILISVLSSSISIWLFGFNKSERRIVKHKIFLFKDKTINAFI